MLEIKTILTDLKESEVFDKNVNEAIADGWELVRRDVLPGWEGEKTIANRKLYAELEREIEPVEEEEPEDDGTAEWKLSRDPAYPYKCSACGCKNPEPAKLCLNCKRKMRNV